MSPRRTMNRARQEGEWVICASCRGEGASSAHLGAYSAEEFREAFDSDEREAYFSGAYDKPCVRCAGKGRVFLEAHREVDDEDVDARPCGCANCRDAAEAQRRADAYVRWAEEGYPEGSFSDYYGGD